MWLDDWRRRMSANLRLLTLLAGVSPLLGLLGTVIGMIVTFQSIAFLDRPVSPAAVADGLWQAMLTTAAGLAIALPSLIAAQGFRIWVAAKAGRLANDLDRLSLALEIVRHGRGAEEGGDDR